MKIAILSECPHIPSSLGKIVYYITRGLLDKGFDVVNVCPSGNITLFKTYMEYCDGDKTFRIYPWKSLSLLKKYYDFDMVLLFGSPYAPPLSDALKECYDKGYNCIGYFDNESYIVIPEYALHAANVSVYASPTEFARRTIAEGLAEIGIDKEVLRERTFVVPHGVDIDYYLNNVVEPVMGDERYVIGTFAKNHIRKNYAVLLESYVSMRREIYDKTILFLAAVGYAGDNRWNIELLVKYFMMYSGRKDIYDHVVVLDDDESSVGLTEKQVMGIYKSMNLFVFPSEGEAFGLPPVEAVLTAKIPVIVSKHPALVEVWSGLPGYCFIDGYVYVLPEALSLFKPDPRRLAHLLEMFVEDEKKYREARDKALEIARRYTADRMVNGIVKLIHLGEEFGPTPLSKYKVEKK